MDNDLLLRLRFRDSLWSNKRGLGFSMGTHWQQCIVHPRIKNRNGWPDEIVNHWYVIKVTNRTRWWNYRFLAFLKCQTQMSCGCARQQHGQRRNMNNYYILPRYMWPYDPLFRVHHFPISIFCLSILIKPFYSVIYDNICLPTAFPEYQEGYKERGGILMCCIRTQSVFDLSTSNSVCTC